MRRPASAARCPACGAELEPGSVFCGNCGADLRNAAGVPNPTAEPQSSVQAGQSQPAASYAEQNTEKKEQGGRIALIVVGIFIVVLLRSCAASMVP